MFKIELIEYVNFPLKKKKKNEKKAKYIYFFQDQKNCSYLSLVQFVIIYDV